MIAYIMCFILFLVGLYGVITRRNLVKIAVSLSIMEISTFLFFALVGYIDGGIAPIVDPADPVKSICRSLAPGAGAYSNCYRTGNNCHADGGYYKALQKVWNF